MKGRCFVCGDRASHWLGIRCRTENGNADWAPNLDAALCGLHAISGAWIKVAYHATETGRVHVVTETPSDRPGHTAIVATVDHPIGANDRQGSLL